jgi:rod shape determining protein RodA
MIFEKKFLRDFDKTLLFIAFLIFLMSIFVLYSATQAKNLPFGKSYILRQIYWMLIGAILLFAIINISYQRFIDIAYILYGINIILLIFVLILGHTRLGAQRWFSIGAFTFQPSEFIKINLILALANYIGARKESMDSFKSLFVPILLLFMPFVLVLMQPDLGTALILLPVFFSMLLVGGVRPRYLVTMLLLGFASLPVFWSFLRGYQRQRLLVFINPNLDPLGAAYTIIQSKIAIGSGGLFGKGWLGGTQNQLNFLPERHTDFIFSVVGEEWGFLGAAILILLYFIIIKRSLNIASSTSDIYGKLIATGVAMMLALQVIINVGMTIGLMPVVGIPLPLVSYGGSSLLATLIAIALLLNIGMRRSTF